MPMIRQKCIKCSGTEFWNVRRGKKRCKKCRYEFVPKVGGMRLSEREWKSLLKWFLRCQSTTVIMEETEMSKYLVLKALSKVREVMIEDIPREFEGIVEVDETYIGGQWRFKRKSVRRRIGKVKRGRGTLKQPVFGILCRGGKVWAQIIEGVEKKDLQPIIEKKVRKGSTICSDTWRGYTGIAAKGYVHRLVKHGEEEYSDGKGNHINGLEGFWGYLKRQLSSRGGIREDRLPVYLIEYIWRFNNRKLDINTKVNKLLNLVAKF